MVRPSSFHRIVVVLAVFGLVITSATQLQNRLDPILIATSIQRNRIFIAGISSAWCAGSAICSLIFKTFKGGAIYAGLHTTARIQFRWWANIALLP